LDSGLRRGENLARDARGDLTLTDRSLVFKYKKNQSVSAPELAREYQGRNTLEAFFARRPQSAKPEPLADP
jgi:hypothetical protein